MRKRGDLVGVQYHDPVGSQVPFKDRQLKPVYPLCLSVSTVGNFAFLYQIFFILKSWKLKHWLNLEAPPQEVW